MLSIGEFAQLGRVSPRALRHYDDVGVLSPARVDRATGYRWYELRQLADLRRIVALRDLGFGLDEIRSLVVADEEVSNDQLRGMLRLRQSELTASIAEDRARVVQIAMHLDALERGDIMRTLDATVKTTEPLRMAEAIGVAPTYGYEHIGPVFADRLPVVRSRLSESGVVPGISVAYFEWPDDDGRVVAHLGFDIGDQPILDDDEVRAVELPCVEVASVIHRGSLDDFTETFAALVAWIDANGYRIAGLSRELYLHADLDAPAHRVTELQIPVARAS
jgi:DNA-binding transcriptional MerR regulator